MSANESKVRDPRFWRKWVMSGAVTASVACLKEWFNILWPNAQHVDSFILRNSQTTFGGRISKYGSVRILSGSVSRYIIKEGDGLECWSPFLYHYRRGSHWAELRNGGMEIFDKDGRKVAIVSTKDIFPVLINRTCVVTRNGWVLGFDEGLDYLDYLDYLELLKVALKEADEGRTPKYKDNSHFIKVSPAFEGQKVIELWLDDDRLVFTLEGKMLEREVLQPLAFANWQEVHSIRIPGGEISEP